jgi:hypothetical protein
MSFNKFTDLALSYSPSSIIISSSRLMTRALLTQRLNDAEPAYVFARLIKCGARAFFLLFFLFLLLLLLLLFLLLLLILVIPFILSLSSLLCSRIPLTLLSCARLRKFNEPLLSEVVYGQFHLSLVRSLGLKSSDQKFSRQLIRGYVKVDAGSTCRS